MDTITMLVNTLYLDQDDTKIVFNHTDGDGFKIEEQFMTTDGYEVGMIIELDKEEKEILLQFLLNK